MEEQNTNIWSLNGFKGTVNTVWGRVGGKQKYDTLDQELGWVGARPIMIYGNDKGGGLKDIIVRARLEEENHNKRDNLKPKNKMGLIPSDWSMHLSLINTTYAPLN